jgi:hypothetical protein
MIPRVATLVTGPASFFPDKPPLRILFAMKSSVFIFERYAAKVEK